MTKGHEYLSRIHEALHQFERAVEIWAKWRPFDSKITRQQEVDAARQRVVDEVVKIVTEERLKKQ